MPVYILQNKNVVLYESCISTVEEIQQIYLSIKLILIVDFNELKTAWSTNDIKYSSIPSCCPFIIEFNLIISLLNIIYLT